MTGPVCILKKKNLPNYIILKSLYSPKTVL